MGNICTNTETKNTQTETLETFSNKTCFVETRSVETRSFGIQTDDHKIILLTVVTPTEFMKSVKSPTSDTDSCEKIIKHDWTTGEVQLQFAPYAKNYQEPKRENPTINFFEDFDFDPNYITN